jgi:hypothetical protein
LFVVLVFGVPPLKHAEVTFAEVMRRTLAAATFTLTVIVLTVGLRLASLEPAGRLEQPVR